MRGAEKIELPGDDLLEIALRTPSISRHVPRIFMPLSGMVDDYISELSLKRNKELTFLLEDSASRIENVNYQRIQTEHLSRAVLEYISGTKFTSVSGKTSVPQKYLDYPFWIKGKYSAAKNLELAHRRGARILDLGAGPGHFSIVAKHYGCECTALEGNLINSIPLTRRHLYDDMADVFALNRVIAHIKPYQNVNVDGRYDIVTCFMGNFSHIYLAEGHPVPWSWKEWQFFLQDLVMNVVVEGEFLLYFSMGREYLAPIAADISDICETFDLQRSVFTITHQSRGRIESWRLPEADKPSVIRA